jgi:hypothetical protein
MQAGDIHSARYVEGGRIIASNPGMAAAAEISSRPTLIELLIRYVQ